MHTINKYEFDVLFKHGQTVKIELGATSAHEAYRYLYEMVNPLAVSEARISMTTER